MPSLQWSGITFAREEVFLNVLNWQYSFLFFRSFVISDFYVSVYYTRFPTFCFKIKSVALSLDTLWSLLILARTAQIFLVVISLDNSS